MKVRYEYQGKIELVRKCWSTPENFPIPRIGERVSLFASKHLGTVTSVEYYYDNFEEVEPEIMVILQ